MDVRVGVAPPGRLETTAVVSSLRAHGLDAVQVRPGLELDVVLVVVHDSVDPHDGVAAQVRRAVGAASGSPVLAMLASRSEDALEGILTVDRSTTTAELARVLGQLAGGAARPSLPRQREAVSRPALDQLTQRQNEIVGLMVQGLRNEEIGARLGISTHTVRTHVQHILNRLDVQHRHGLASLVGGSHASERGRVDASSRQEAS